MLSLQAVNSAEAQLPTVATDALASVLLADTEPSPSVLEGIVASIQRDPWLLGFMMWDEACFQLNLHEDVYFEPFYTMLAASLLGVAARVPVSFVVRSPCFGDCIVNLAVSG